MVGTGVLQGFEFACLLVSEFFLATLVFFPLSKDIHVNW